MPAAERIDGSSTLDEESAMNRSLQYLFFARLGTHHVCIPELCPWIDLHAALFVTLPVTLDRANLPASAWSPPDAQKSATKRPIWRPAQPLGTSPPPDARSYLIRRLSPAITMAIAACGNLSLM
ncbi:uncharacterized protein TrAtP1_012813 [Trichoderma atroviride]|uniref:uncharacterized protein n=1 Tax=Hypocrea atroviridis TaxID=63577 RepID=UPI003317912B|nr:hypothetical protein TrAtP1_012813 [Trichoderma atroviride]